MTSALMVTFLGWPRSPQDTMQEASTDLAQWGFLGTMLAGGSLGRSWAPNPTACEGKNGWPMAAVPLDSIKYHPSFVPAQASAQETRKDVPSCRARRSYCWGLLPRAEAFVQPMHAFVP